MARVMLVSLICAVLTALSAARRLVPPPPNRRPPPYPVSSPSHSFARRWTGPADVFGGQPDYVIVGGGPAGFVLAEQLSRGPNVTVVLLEAGPENAGNPDIDIPIFAPYLIGTPSIWNYSSQPDPNLDGEAPTLEQGRGFGGGTAVNYLGHCRGAPSVFNEWADISGDDGLRWENFLDSHRAVTHYTQTPLDYDPHINASVYGDGPIELVSPNDDLGSELRVIEALQSTLDLPWVDLNDGSALGVTAATLGVRASNRTRVYAPQAFGWQLAGRPNAQQLYNAQVTKIGFDGTRANSVTLVNPLDNTTVALNAKEIIVSAGALNSPKLLLLSGVGPADHLRSVGIDVVADIPEVGRNLYDHHFSFLEYEVTSEVETLYRYQENASFAAQANAEYQETPFADGPLGQPNGAAFAIYRAPDSVFAGVNSTFHVDLPDDRGQLLLQYATVAFNPADNFTNIVSPFVAVVQPEASGYMQLASANYQDDPLIFSNYYGSESDKAAILYGYKRLREVFADPALAPIVVKEVYPGPNVTTDQALWDAIQVSASSFHHPIGTVALGSVLEGKTWRVKGLQGLRVVDSSTFPYPTTCHPMANVYAYAYHAAQLIKEQDDFSGSY